MNLAARDHLIRARTALYIDHPFYGVLALRLTMVEDTSVKTLCVNYTQIRYNPDFVMTLPDNLAKSAVAHEIGHIFWDHLDRCGARHPRKWNAAGDYVINAGLKEDGMEVGKTWLYNRGFAGMSADEIYTLLPDEPDDGQGGWGELDAMEPSGNPDEAAENKLDFQIAAIGAAKIAEKQGKLPARLKRLVDSLVDNKVDWRARLRQFVTEVSDADYDWSHPQRRMLPFGYILPSLYSEAMGLVVNALDTSGSISDFVLQAFGAEILAIRDAVSPEGLVNIYCDAAVAHVDTYDQFEPITFEGHGGGGTDFRPPFAYVEQYAIKPACFIYLTDGLGPFPATPPPYPVLWVMTTDVVPPWGEHVRIEV